MCNARRSNAEAPILECGVSTPSLLERLQCLQQLFQGLEIDWFDQVVVETGCLGLTVVFFGCRTPSRLLEPTRRVPVATAGAGNSPAIYSGQANVQKYKLGPIRCCHDDRLATIVDRANIVAYKTQQQWRGYPPSPGCRPQPRYGTSLRPWPVCCRPVRAQVRWRAAC